MGRLNCCYNTLSALENCFVYSIFCAFYILLTTQCCTIQHASPCFKVNFIELNKGVLSGQSSGHTKRVVIKMKQTQRKAQTLVNNTQLQSRKIPQTLTRRYYIPANTHYVCPAALGGIWLCRARAKWRLKGKRHLKHGLLGGEWNLISSPANLVLFHSASGSGRRICGVLFDNRCLC